MEWPACQSRRSVGENDELFICDDPRVRAARRLVARDVCVGCGCRREPLVEQAGDRNAKERARTDPLADAGDQLPSARLAKGMERQVADWAVGVTTAPRRKPTLERCLDSLAAAGWDEPRIFVEPGVVLHDRFAALPRTLRDVRLGAFPNWYLGLIELYLRQPRAEAYFICQDDAIFAAGLREYLEGVLWPAKTVGVVSVYTPSHWSGGQSRGFHVERRGWNTWGALAYIFPNPSVRQLLGHPLVVNHRHHGNADGLRNIDSVVGAWCDSAALPYYVHVPSLVQHIGETSTIWTRASATGPRRAGDFVETVEREAAQTPRVQGGETHHGE